MDSGRPLSSAQSPNRFTVSPMSQKASMMRCPKCGDEQKQSDICAECGIVVEKYLKIKQSSPYEPAATGGASCMNDVDEEASVFPVKMMAGLGVFAVAVVIVAVFYLI